VPATEFGPLDFGTVLKSNWGMTATEIIEQIKSLPASERAQVAKFVVEQADSRIPDEFKEAKRDAEAGRVVDLETVLSGAPPPQAFAKWRGRGSLPVGQNTEDYLRLTRDAPASRKVVTCFSQFNS